MSQRSTRRRLNRALARLDRAQAGGDEVGSVEKARQAATPVVANSRRPLGLVAALVLAVLVGAAVLLADSRRFSALEERVDELAASNIALAAKATDRDSETRKSADALERALAVANRQASALENANKIASDALSAGKRAWVGVVNARIDGRLAANTDLALLVEYRNSGHEPATDLAVIQTPIVIETDKRADPATLSRLEQFAQRCMAENYVGAGIAFPSGDGQTYQAEAAIKASDIDDALVDGRKLVIVQGCIVYMTSGSIHHSSSCLYFQAGRTSPDHFSTCAKGAAAD